LDRSDALPANIFLLHMPLMNEQLVLLMSAPLKAPSHGE